MDDSLQPTEAREATTLDTEFKRGLGLFDSTMIVVGSMIGSRASLSLLPCASDF